MKRLFLDTNFLLDLLVRQENKWKAQQFLIKFKTEGCDFVVSFLSVANFAYIMRKSSKSELYNYLSVIDELFEIVSNSKDQIIDAISDNWNDFEDAIQYETAIKSGCDCIVTRNRKDFILSKLPIIDILNFLDEKFKVNDKHI